jgi:predicted outer membrane protein
MKAPVQPEFWASATPETRILSAFQVVDQEEIEVGKLAQQKAKSDMARQYGDMLVRDHTDHLGKVKSTAQSAGVTLLTTEQAKAGLKYEKEKMRHDMMGMPNDKDMPGKDATIKPGDRPSSQPSTQPTDTNRPGDTNQPGKQPSETPRVREGGSPQTDMDRMGRDKEDVLAALRSAEGDQFDAMLGEKMQKGHAMMIKMVEHCQPKVQNPDVKALLDKTLPVLREHQQMASQLAAAHPMTNPDHMTNPDRNPTKPDRNPTNPTNPGNPNPTPTNPK